MIRNFKTLGLALVAVFALGAMAASAAQATNPGKFTSKTGTYPLTLDATTTEPAVFQAFATETTCKHAQFTSTSINAASESVLMTPEKKECHIIIMGTTLSVTITYNGCEYRLYNATTEGAPSEDNYKLTTDIVCPEGKVIEVHFYGSAATHAEGKSLCTFTLGSQNGLEGITAHSDTANGDVVLTGTLTGVHTVQHRNSFLCPAGTTTTTAAFKTPEKGLTVTGTNGAGTSNPFHIG